MGTYKSPNFSPDEMEYILSQAYIPEHIPGLMVGISKAEPFILEGYLGYAKDNWVIFVGYPIEGQYEGDHCSSIIDQVLDSYHPEYIWMIAPEIPPSIMPSCRTRQRDHYYYLDLDGFHIKSSLRRQVKRAARKLSVDHGNKFDQEHQSLVDELLRRQKLPPMIEELYRSMPDYIASCDTARVLNAWDLQGNLAAFFVIETAAKGFDTHLLGCYTKKNYIPHASDLLFSEMISLARQRYKPGINLGLGVSPGIRRFKKKWGGVKTLAYEHCECYYGPPEQLSMVDLLLGSHL